MKSTTIWGEGGVDKMEMSCALCDATAYALSPDDATDILHGDNLDILLPAKAACRLFVQRANVAPRTGKFFESSHPERCHGCEHHSSKL